MGKKLNSERDGELAVRQNINIAQKKNTSKINLAYKVDGLKKKC